jgi:hypothetical protein
MRACAVSTPHSVSSTALPSELWQDIALYLHLQDLLILRLISKLYREAASIKCDHAVINSIMACSWLSLERTFERDATESTVTVALLSLLHESALLLLCLSSGMQSKARLCVFCSIIRYLTLCPHFRYWRRRVPQLLLNRLHSSISILPITKFIQRVAVIWASHFAVTSSSCMLRQRNSANM